MKTGWKMADVTSGAMALAMLVAFLLAGVGIKLALNRQTRGRGILMIVAALVLVMNVMIWTV
jgi:high-affinity Fe2+/Pb2+ permease